MAGRRDRVLVGALWKLIRDDELLRQYILTRPLPRQLLLDLLRAPFFSLHPTTETEFAYRGHIDELLWREYLRRAG